MKKIFAFLLSFCLLAALGGCAKTVRTDASAKAALEAMCAVASPGENAVRYFSESDNEIDYLDDDILSGKYGKLMEAPTTAQMTQYAVCFTVNYETELGVFCMKTEDDAVSMKSFLENRIADMKQNAVNYPAVDTALVDSCVIGSDGVWVWYYLTNDNAGVKTALEAQLY